TVFMISLPTHVHTLFPYTTLFRSVLNYISKELEIKHEQTQIDNHEKSALDKIIYGYTPLWSQKINIMNNPTNVQIAVTSNEKGMVNFTVGTPILINEY